MAVKVPVYIKTSEWVPGASPLGYYYVEHTQCVMTPYSSTAAEAACYVESMVSDPKTWLGLQAQYARNDMYWGRKLPDAAVKRMKQTFEFYDALETWQRDEAGDLLKLINKHAEIAASYPKLHALVKPETIQAPPKPVVKPKFTLHQEDEIVDFYQALRTLAGGSSVEIAAALDRYKNAADNFELKSLQKTLKFILEQSE